MKMSIPISLLFLLALSAPAFAQGFFGQLLCSGNITDQVRGQVRGSASFSVGFLDLEIMNNSKIYRVTAISIHFEGSYNGREFIRRYDNRELEILPGTSARLVLETDIPGSYMDKVDVDGIRVVEYFGCRK
jgi:hypothetical protein